jgi:hypothetical protein
MATRRKRIFCAHEAHPPREPSPGRSPVPSLFDAPAGDLVQKARLKSSASFPQYLLAVHPAPRR